MPRTSAECSTPGRQANNVTRASRHTGHPAGSSLPALPASSAGVGVPARVAAALVAVAVVAVVLVEVVVVAAALVAVVVVVAAALVAVAAVVAAGDVKSFANRECF